MLSAENIVFSYDNRNTCLDNVSFSLGKGEFAAVLGANGSGKSTLARVLAGFLAPDSGSVIYHGIDRKDLRRRVAIVFQNPDNQFVERTVYSELMFICRNLSIPGSHGRISEVLGEVGLSGFEKRDPSTLSGGEKARLLIASAIIREPQVLILDESFSMLDHDTASSCISLIMRLRSELCMSVVLITHNIEEALGADSVYLMRGGRVVCSGTPDSVMRDADALSDAGITPLRATLFASRLRIRPSRLPLDADELLEVLCC